MALELEAKLLEVFEELTGEGRNGKWVKQNFLVETNETYPKKIMFAAWGDKIEGIKNLNKGDVLKVSFNAESREFNGKWYTDLKVWKIEKVIYKDALGVKETHTETQAENSTPYTTKEETDDLPF